MVTLIKRMTRLKTLLSIRVGPGAAILPPEVTRIHMDFARKQTDGHLGPRRFWRTYLPRLKYYNPAVPMTVNRTIDQIGPATMTIHFTETTSAIDPAPGMSSSSHARPLSAVVSDPTTIAPKERTASINMKHRHEIEILSQFLSITKALPVQPTEADLEALRELEEKRRLSEIDAKRTREVVEQKKKEEAMLAQARGIVAANGGEE